MSTRGDTIQTGMQRKAGKNTTSNKAPMVVFLRCAFVNTSWVLFYTTGTQLKRNRSTSWSIAFFFTRSQKPERDQTEFKQTKTYLLGTYLHKYRREPNQAGLSSLVVIKKTDTFLFTAPPR